MHARPPSKELLDVYGGEPEDYMDEVIVFPAIAGAIAIHNAMRTQWRIAPSGHVTGLEYSSLPVVFDALDVQDRGSALRDVQVMETAALSILNE